MFYAKKIIIKKKFYFFISLLCICIVGACFWPKIIQWQHDVNYHQDILAIENIYRQFHQSIRNDFQIAYSHMPPKYRQECTIEQFKAVLINTDYELYNYDLHSEYYLNIDKNKANLYPEAYTPRWGKWNLSVEPLFGPEYEIIKLSGKWYFTGNYIFYFDGYPIEHKWEECKELN